MEKNFLVLIHLQPGMVERAPLALIDRVTELVREYMLLAQPILILELEGYEATCGWLKAILADYVKATYLLSELTDGSSDLLQAMNLDADAAYASIKIEVGGLYSYACVYDTVAGLASKIKGSEIAVVKSACDNYMADDWGAFERLLGVSLVA